MRQIYPVPPGGPSELEPLGPADPLRLAGPIRASGAARQAGVDELVSTLASYYAYPQRPWVRANMVASVDGAIALDGKSAGLSGAGDRVLFWVLRSLADAVLVGAATARAENYGRVPPGLMWPELRAGRPPAPPIVVITRQLDLDLDGRLFADGGRPGEARTIVLTTEQAPAQRRRAAEAVADVLVAGERDVAGAAAIEALASRGYRKVLAEGGPQLLGELAAGGVLDEVCLTISPVLEGGYSASRVLAAPSTRSGADPAAMAGLRLTTLLEDDGFLFARYIRADRGQEAP